jgi:hypothetical protein
LPELRRSASYSRPSARAARLRLPQVNSARRTATSRPTTSTAVPRSRIVDGIASYRQVMSRSAASGYSGASSRSRNPRIARTYAVIPQIRRQARQPAPLDPSHLIHTCARYVRLVSCRFSTLMSPETALTCGPAEVLIDLSAGFFSPICHFLRWPAAGCGSNCPAAPSTEPSSGHAIQRSSRRTRHQPCDTARQRGWDGAHAGRRTRDTVTDSAPGHAVTPVTFSRTCRKRHLGDKRSEKATSEMRTYISFSSLILIAGFGTL